MSAPSTGSGSQLPAPFGKYTLVERIAAGGMAEVYKAKIFGVAGFEKTVAVKRILPHFAEDDGFVDMFVREANIAVRLTHSNIVQVFELGRVGSDYFIALEYVEGRDLKSLVRQANTRKRHLPPAVAAFMTQKICAGLHHAHVAIDDASGMSLGIVHRDVSPHNVLVSWSGEVKVADFGIAKLQTRSRNTQTGMIKGKLAYMSPEQSLGDPNLDARSDVFAAGIVLYELLTGRRPFDGESDLEILRNIREKHPPPPSALAPGVPPELDAIVAKAMAKAREDRHPDAASMARALGAYLQRTGSADGRVVDESNVAELMRELLGGRTPSPSQVSKSDSAEGRGGGTPILSLEEIEPSATPTPRSPSREPADAGFPSAPLAGEKEDTVVFAAAPPTADVTHTPASDPRRPRPSRSGSAIPVAEGSSTTPSERTPMSTQPSPRAIATRSRAGFVLALGAIAVAALGGGYGVVRALGGGESVTPAPATTTPVVIASSVAPTATPLAIVTATVAPAPTAKPAPTVAPTAGTGRILVEGAPVGAMVWVDGGKWKGRVGAPIGGVTAGDRTLLVAAEGFTAATRRTSVVAGRTSSLRVELARATGEIRIEGPKSPYSVFMKGRGVQKLTTLSGVEAGMHEISVSDGARTVKVFALVKDGQVTRVQMHDPLRDGLSFAPAKP